MRLKTEGGLKAYRSPYEKKKKKKKQKKLLN